MDKSSKKSDASSSEHRLTTPDLDPKKLDFKNSSKQLTMTDLMKKSKGVSFNLDQSESPDVSD